MSEQTLVKGMCFPAEVVDDDTVEIDGVRYRRVGLPPEGYQERWAYSWGRFYEQSETMSRAEAEQMFTERGGRGRIVHRYERIVPANSEPGAGDG